MTGKRRTWVVRLNLTAEEQEIVKKMGEVLRIEPSLTGQDRYGTILCEFFRLVREYMVEHPTSPFALQLDRMIAESRMKPKRRRGIMGIVDKVRAPFVPRLREDYSVDEAHEAALDEEAKRILKSARG